MKKKTGLLGLAILTSIFLLDGCAAFDTTTNSEQNDTEEKKTNTVQTLKDEKKKQDIEQSLDLKNNSDQAWSYSKDEDGWVLSIVTVVTNPEIEEQQGVSVCVPGAYVTGIDTNSDGKADITEKNYSDTVKGTLVIDHEAKITSTNGQVYTADEAPVILNTGAAGYGSAKNTAASTMYAKEGYINVACGNRGKQDTATNEAGEEYYTGDAPLCLVDQKNAARYVKYNILLGNLPGNVDYFVSTGGSGGGAHATMFVATSNHSDYYDYEIEAGAVGVYENSDGSYATTVTIDGKEQKLSDGAWGCIAYSAITSLEEADAAMAFEYFMDTTYEFSTPFQSQLAEYLSKSYMEYINGQDLSVSEAEVGFDLNDDGDKKDNVKLTIQYDLDKYPETNGYYGSYLDLYLAEFTENLQWYLDNLDYTQDWTWFNESGEALSNEEVSAMSTTDRATAFIEGRYTKSTATEKVEGGMAGPPAGELPTEMMGDGGPPNSSEVGTPDAGTSQSVSGGVDSTEYATYEEMLAAYKADITEIEKGDKYGNNLVDLYNPLNYIGKKGTENPTWSKIIMGASEGDMSLFSSLNLQLAWLDAGVASTIEWQWDGGHVPSEILGDSFSLFVDQMYGEYTEKGKKIDKTTAEKQGENGSESTATGTDISSWVNYDDANQVSFTLADIAAYRTTKASKAIPGFDVIDYGQEDYVFGSTTKDARHWNRTLLDIFEENSEKLAPLFNKSE
ncbi:hypothetical protein [Enterococcus raffinosus]|uniref:Tannase n=1 Tax=Enterococcus raffinosus TaxID=71452 RepID=A0AAW8T5V7_9ENTE|nr:hypothetical protein [Enterococcus raffinosus]MDT2522683.1 hypothetical protein [Enterococcus raffinosus]MDT2529927.1 hypothetical protein [Enterococcus raffinosus]MDT2532951.1 hypothetical protein [Enterococcus raffinosus]MDT2543864.1 hypothetical protein [Enterococcus raffinosus]MDT2554997.1 hypothetical protein [Enterococcus raffinosus]